MVEPGIIVVKADLEESKFGLNDQNLTTTAQSLAEKFKSFKSKKGTKVKPKPTIDEILEASKEKEKENAALILDSNGQKSPKEQKFEDNGEIRQLQIQRVQEAKNRLRCFVVFTDMSDQKEKFRLIKYFTNRYATFIKLLQEFSRERKELSKSQDVMQPPSIQSNPIQLKSLHPEDESYAEKEIAYMIKKKKLPADQIVFKVLGQYHCLRDYLNSRGMVENEWKPKFEGHKFNNTAWHFLYTTKSRDAFRIPVLDWQFINHIAGSKALTTKVGLTHTMNNLIWQHDRDISQTFPCSFDLSDLASEETFNFQEDAKFNAVLAWLKARLAESKVEEYQDRTKLETAIAIVDRRVSILSGSIFQKILLGEEFMPGPLDCISDQIYNWYKHNKPFSFLDQRWFENLNESSQKFQTSTLLAQAQNSCDSFKNLIGRKQFDLNIGHNAWILKPGGKSRGRGIEIYTDFEELLKSIKLQKDTIWIVQKYIEKPLIIIGKKFDIRVWVLVTSVEPLNVWMFMKPYLRFTSEDYDANQLDNKFMHLTNASISKYNLNAQLVKQSGEYKIENNMWETENFKEFLRNEYGQYPGLTSNDPLQEVVFPQIKQGVIDSLLATKEVLQHRARSHELYGYDFMVDTELSVWLIEVNSSPSMEFSTPITEKLVKQVMPQIVRILLDHDHGSAGNKVVGDKIEDFELIYK